MQGHLSPYKLIGDVVDSMRPRIYCPFKANKTSTLEGYKRHTFFIHFATHICVGNTFGILECMPRGSLRRDRIVHFVLLA